MEKMFFKKMIAKFRGKMGNPKFLCDTCQYDYPSACRHPERPNAVVCPDYRKR